MNTNGRKLFGSALVFLALSAACVVNAAMVTPTRLTIVTQDGPVSGIPGGVSDQFFSIPYAAAPVGKLRWMPPQPHGHWHGVLDATQFSLDQTCIQPDGSGGTFGKEDCLFLNVIRPHRNNNGALQRLPVMVWIHGGGFTIGAGIFFDPTPLVARGKGVLVVTINYRLGFLGFFAHPAIDAEGHLNANYALMDQQFALKWVKRNIAAFGGDPNRVTIFGESAGGESVYSEVASPTAAGLFKGAISESGAGALFQDYFNSIVPLKTAEATGTTVAADIGCGSQTAECLRGVSAATLVQAEDGFSFAPIVDGTVLTQTLDSAFAKRSNQPCAGNLWWKP